MDPVYLDYNATTPIDPMVSEAMLPFITQHFGNPSSGHAYGVKTHLAVENARSQISSMIGCNSPEIVFTSGGTEANNYAIQGIAGAYKKKGSHIITSSIEHPAITEVCKYMETKGCTTTYVPVDQYGRVDPNDVEKAITDDTILITIMHANNEVGTIQPIQEIAHIAHKHSIFIHSDCAQSVGKIPVDVNDLGVDLLSIAGHKLYAPKGVGALYVRNGVKLEKLMHGANHENGLRAGTENVILIVALGEACRLIENHLPEYRKTMQRMRNLLETELTQGNIDSRVNGHPTLRLPNTLSIGFNDVQADELLLNLTSIASSAGAACHTDNIEISSVLEAMQVPLEYAAGTIRLSVGRYTTKQEISHAVKEITTWVEHKQSMQIKGA
ncbi:MAG: cysteine desulfurase NifS [Dehalococcoidia bacterium]|nr:cysteine desulfurase NifS [Dehalococcoidia bacterium]|tara:strand:- start:11654 stop:12805 length:1152 start_codon:yes stop_codon:yes gene_type:complete